MVPASRSLPFLAGILLAFAAGCGQPPAYSPALDYPLRKDWLVELTPTVEPEGPYPNGKLDESIADLRRLGGKVHDPATISESNRSELQRALLETFGTPAAPTVASDDEDAATVHEMGLTSERLAEGSRLFRRHCLQCHGLAGDGRGPTGPWIYPTPRDFRQGVFKFVSSIGTGSRKPRRADLLQTLRNGLPGTAMPSFRLLDETQLGPIADYVVHLSLRGEVEYRTSLALHAGGEASLDGTIAEEARATLKSALRQWKQAEESSIEPKSAPTPEAENERMAPAHLDSVRRGHRLFVEASGAGCASCHVDYGRQSRHRYDVWGTVVRPPDLTKATYKGGKQPLDHFRRIHGGIGPSGMSAVVGRTETELWDLVHFVQAAPYPRMLPPDVRGQVYGGAGSTNGVATANDEQ